MPGGRLSDQDRRHIASGLGEGLGYAEIARRLGRPTSTVSREVARNGGPEGYRADHAREATGRRARRRGPASPPELPVADGAGGRDPEAVRAFVERFAALMVQTGLPRMAARVLACLYTTDSGALTPAELVMRLRVSPASVSKAIGYLGGLEVIRRERGARRGERYVIDDDVWERAWMTSARSNAMWADAAREGAEIFGAISPAGARLARASRFFARLGDDMAGGPTAAAVGDALTVLAALVHASTPLSAQQLATALDWPADRVTSALHDAERYAEVIDPVALRRTADGACTVTARLDRLTTTQREALDGCCLRTPASSAP
ncbi:helix-turn-helix domain-containing protein [Sorangium sp. So ce260]|uniref:GbsR/MarR family transcriptional regulator n=1 Tax=Sorangium sp. So ce260 TaxID=3133291 RepID=UPI003F5FEC5C